MENKYYIAYGSNLNVLQMKHRCPTARIVETGMLLGWQLLFKGSKTGSYLTIEKAKGGRVPVTIWEITKADEENLDRYEGYPSFYYKKNITVKCRDKKTGNLKSKTAMVYIMHEDRPLGIPTRAYVETCLDGYRYFGFDTSFLMNAIGRSKGGVA